MAQWRKLLAAMVADTRPTSYTYAQAASVLRQLHFEEDGGGSSHRRWRRRLSAEETGGPPRTVIIGLVDKGHGTLKPPYIRHLVRTLQENNLLPPGV